jgi:hypothetical protein
MFDYIRIRVSRRALAKLGPAPDWEKAEKEVKAQMAAERLAKRKAQRIARRKQRRAQ